MSIETLAQVIMQSRRVKNKAVILCEGNVDSVKDKGFSPSFYRKLETFPDANFYKACLPKEIRSHYCPQFFNCGSRSDVLQVFAKLSSINHTPENSYLDTNKLFALVDLDIQKTEIDNYHFQDTEAVFNDLYKALLINPENIDKHHIFTTGLIHKEAYFLLPELESLFNSYKNTILYQENPFDFQTLYQNIINDLDGDKDLKNNFSSCICRLNFCNIDKSSLETVKDYFSRKFGNSNNLEEVKKLFLLRKAKPYWQQLNCQETLALERFHEQLSLEIARYYSNQNDPSFHLTAIFNSIYKRSYSNLL